MGLNYYGSNTATSYSTATVNGSDWSIGGLTGYSSGSIITSYSTGTVRGNSLVGGLVGIDYGHVIMSYNMGPVMGNEDVGGLVGDNKGIFGTGNTTSSFWDTETPGQTESAGGEGKTTAEIQTAKTFLDAGWDLTDETINGEEEVWWILKGQDYPRLWWELIPEN